MGYDVKVLEQLQIHVVDKATAFLAKSLGYYIDNFFTAYWIRSLDIDYAKLTIDGATVELKDIHNEDGKVTYRATRGKNKGKFIALTSKPCDYYAFRNQARQHLPYAQDVSFTVKYQADCSFGADIGMCNMINALESLDCVTLRENVVYKAFEESHPGEGFNVYRYDRDFRGYDPVCSNLSVLKAVNGWEADGYCSILCNEEGLNPLESAEVSGEVIGKIRPLLEKYGFAIGKCDRKWGEINIENLVTVSSDRLDEFFSDFQAFLDILASYHLELVPYTEGLVSDDSRNPGIIRLSLDENGLLRKTYNVA